MFREFLRARRTRLARQEFKAELEVWQPPVISEKALVRIGEQVEPETLLGRCFRNGSIFAVTPSSMVLQIPNDGQMRAKTEVPDPKGYFVMTDRYLGGNQWERLEQPIAVVSAKGSNLIDGIQREDDRFRNVVTASRRDLAGPYY